MCCTAAANKLANAVLRGWKRPHRLNHYGVECSFDVEVVFGGVEARKGEADGCAGVALRGCFLHECVAVLRLKRRPGRLSLFLQLRRAEAKTFAYLGLQPCVCDNSSA